MVDERYPGGALGRSAVSAVAGCVGAELVNIDRARSLELGGRGEHRRRGDLAAHRRWETPPT
jgi:hypothetical protein